MIWRARSVLLGLLVAVVLVGSSEPAAAYEFEIRTRVVGQGSQLRSFRFLGRDLLLDRRRFTTSISLELWDLSGRTKGLKLHDPEPAGPRVFVSSFLRLDHDFGEWTTGPIVRGGRQVDAVDLIPELEPSSLALDLLYGFVGVEGLLDGRLDMYAGRLLEVGALEWWSLDGAKVRLATPLNAAVEVTGGLRVRDDSPLGSNVQELDGTAGASCAEYVEGAAPGSGSWRPIDRDVLGVSNLFDSDFDLCPQRQEAMPTWGLALETDKLPSFWARIGYRRTVSRTPGLIGPADRFDFEDVGLYPNENGQAPKWGVNQEEVTATARYRWQPSREVQVVPDAAIRYSLLHGLVDRASASVRLRRGIHTIEPEVFYSFPTFDGDSIFNIFSSESYVDYRMTYSVGGAGLRSSPWRGYARGWMRRFTTEDADRTKPDESVDGSSFAGGAQFGGSYRPSRELRARLELFHENGFGGRRTGGYASARWQERSTLGFNGRLSVVDFAADGLSQFDGATVGAQMGITYRINLEGVAVHLLVEENSNRFNRSQLRVIGVLDLAFLPEI